VKRWDEIRDCNKSHGLVLDRNKEKRITVIGNYSYFLSTVIGVNRNGEV